MLESCCDLVTISLDVTGMALRAAYNFICGGVWQWRDCVVLCLFCEEYRKNFSIDDIMHGVW